MTQHSNDQTTTDALPVAVGARLREIRQERRETLRYVAGQVNISPSLLSQVETGKTQPSVGTLYALVNFYGVSLDAVLGQRTQSGALPATGAAAQQRPVFAAVPIQRGSENPTIEMEDGVRWERLAAAINDVVEPLLVTYAPGASSSYDGKWTRHDGVEYGFVMSGRLTLHLEFDTYVIEPGDSVCFDSTRPHFYVNEGEEPARSVFFVNRLGAGDADDSSAGQASDAPPVGSIASVLAALRTESANPAAR